MDDTKSTSELSALLIGVKVGHENYQSELTPCTWQIKDMVIASRGTWDLTFSFRAKHPSLGILRDFI